MSDDADGWSRLGRMLRERREKQLDPRYYNRKVFARERGINYKLAYDIEEFRRTDFAPVTLEQIADAYEVTYESIRSVLDYGAGNLVPVPGRPVRPVPPRGPEAAGPASGAQPGATLGDYVGKVWAIIYTAEQAGDPPFPAEPVWQGLWETDRLGDGPGAREKKAELIADLMMKRDRSRGVQGTQTGLYRIGKDHDPARI